QVHRPWRCTTTSQGLSSVHIRPKTPSYTPPQLQLPGVRDPRRDYPFEYLSVQCGTTPRNSNTSIQGPLARHPVMSSRRVIACYAAPPPLNPSPPLMDSRRGLLHQRKIGLRCDSRGSPIYSAGLCARAASLTPVTPKNANDCCFLF